MGSTCASGKADCSVIWIASMVVDRFAALRPMNSSYPAQLTTRLLQLNFTSCISINADPADGSLRVEILDRFGYRVCGYEAANATAIVDDDGIQCERYLMASSLLEGALPALRGSLH